VIALSEIIANSALVITAVSHIGLTCIVVYVIVRRMKKQPHKEVDAKPVPKASPKNLDRGTLELSDSTIKFHPDKGRFKKQEEIVKEIPLAGVENIDRVANEISITWKGVTETFIMPKAELAITIYERITAALEEQRKMVEDNEAAKQKQNVVTKQLISIALEIVDSLFNVLRSLQGRVDVNRLEGYLEHSEENVMGFTDLNVGTVNLDLTKLSSAIKAHLLEETQKEIYAILRSLHDYFSGLASQSEVEQTHPNYNDAKTVILAYYTLNDIILGTIVGDKEIGKERNALVMMLDDLSKGTASKIDIDAIKDAINKLVKEKGQESVIEESRVVFKQQLKELITA
jgi:hypothetical protein